MTTCSKLLFASAATLCALVPGAHAQLCSNGTLKGSFGYTVTGTITRNTGPLIAGPFVAVGRLVFDGVGTVTTVRAFNDNGTALTGDAGSGTYNLGADCTGSFDISVGPPGSTIQLTLQIVVDDNYQLRGVVTTPDVVLGLEGRKQVPFLF